MGSESWQWRKTYRAKQACHKESELMGLFKKEFDSKLLSDEMIATVTEIFGKMSHEKFSRPPTMKRRPIIVEGENERMIASGFYKNFGSCYISSVNYYLSQHHADKHKPCGTLNLYLSQVVAAQVLAALNLLTKAKVNDAILCDLCGELCNMFGGSFMNKLGEKGYRGLVASTPTNFMDKAPDGVEFSFELDYYHEFQFYLYNEKAIVLDLALTAIPKRL